jgi:hypothetical protein
MMSGYGAGRPGGIGPVWIGMIAVLAFLIWLASDEDRRILTVSPTNVDLHAGLGFSVGAGGFEPPAPRL